MKILYHHRIGSKDGQFVHIEELTGALARRGHEVVIVGPRAVESDAFGAEAGLIDWLKRVLPGFLYELAELAYAVPAYLRLRRAVRQHAPDCLYERYNLFLPCGVWLKKRHGLPMLIEVNAPLADERARFSGLTLKRLARWSERYAWTGADFALPVTEVLAERVRAVGVPDARIRVIHNGIDRDRFAGAVDVAAAKASLGLSGKLVLGFTGFMRPWHGLDRVVRFIARAGRGDLHLLMVGDGPARAPLESLARELGIEQAVTVTGVVPRDRVAEHVAAFDVALQPDVVTYASPLKLFEYMAMGKAIVAPARPNIREILTDGDDAMLFDADAEGALEQALENICADDDLRRRLGAGAAATITRRDFTWDGNAARVEELYRGLGVE